MIPIASLKFLVDNDVAGVIIGRGGSSIHSIQAISGAQLQISPFNHFYPGTLQRVVLISGGSWDVIDTCQKLVWEKIYNITQEKYEVNTMREDYFGLQDSDASASASASAVTTGDHSATPLTQSQSTATTSTSSSSTELGRDRGGGEGPSTSTSSPNPNPNPIPIPKDRTAPPIIFGSVLIPVAASGLIIGKRGETVRAIAERSGARVKLSPKEATSTSGTHERIVYISSQSIESCQEALSWIVQALMTDEKVNMYVVPTFGYEQESPYGQGFVGQSLDVHPIHMGVGLGDMSVVNGVGVGEMHSGGSPISGSPVSRNHGEMSQQSALFIPMQSMNGLNGLQVRGIQGMQLGVPMQLQPPTHAHTHDMGGIPSSELHMGTTPVTLSFIIADTQVGCIIGTRGSSILEIQRMTGARVVVSDRNGDTDRTVTITGPHANTQHAHQLLLQKLKVTSSFISQA